MSSRPSVTSGGALKYVGMMGQVHNHMSGKTNISRSGFNPMHILYGPPEP